MEKTGRLTFVVSRAIGAFSRQDCRPRKAARASRVDGSHQSPGHQVVLYQKITGGGRDFRSGCRFPYLGTVSTLSDGYAQLPQTPFVEHTAHHSTTTVPMGNDQGGEGCIRHRIVMKEITPLGQRRQGKGQVKAKLNTLSTVATSSFSYHPACYSCQRRPYWSSAQYRPRTRTQLLAYKAPSHTSSRAFSLL